MEANVPLAGLPSPVSANSGIYQSEIISLALHPHTLLQQRINRINLHKKLNHHAKYWQDAIALINAFLSRRIKNNTSNNPEQTLLFEDLAMQVAVGVNLDLRTASVELKDKPGTPHGQNLTTQENHWTVLMHALKRISVELSVISEMSPEKFSESLSPRAVLPCVQVSAYLLSSVRESEPDIISDLEAHVPALIKIIESDIAENSKLLNVHIHGTAWYRIKATLELGKWLFTQNRMVEAQKFFQLCQLTFEGNISEEIQHEVQGFLAACDSIRPSCTSFVDFITTENNVERTSSGQILNLDLRHLNPQTVQFLEKMHFVNQPQLKVAHLLQSQKFGIIPYALSVTEIFQGSFEDIQAYLPGNSDYSKDFDRDDLRELMDFFQTSILLDRQIAALKNERIDLDEECSGTPISGEVPDFLSYDDVKRHLLTLYSDLLVHPSGNLAQLKTMLKGEADSSLVRKTVFSISSLILTEDWTIEKICNPTEHVLQWFLEITRILMNHTGNISIDPRTFSSSTSVEGFVISQQIIWTTLFACRRFRDLITLMISSQVCEEDVFRNIVSTTSLNLQVTTSSDHIAAKFLQEDNSACLNLLIRVLRMYSSFNTDGLTALAKVLFLQGDYVDFIGSVLRICELQSRELDDKAAQSEPGGDVVFFPTRAQSLVSLSCLLMDDEWVDMIGQALAYLHLPFHAVIFCQFQSSVKYDFVFQQLGQGFNSQNHSILRKDKLNLDSRTELDAFSFLEYIWDLSILELILKVNRKKRPLLDVAILKMIREPIYSCSQDSQQWIRHVHCLKTRFISLLTTSFCG